MSETKIFWMPFESSNLLAMHYDSDKRELHIRFKSSPKIQYVYADVGSATATDFLNAASPGGFFRKYIRDRFSFKRLPFEEQEKHDEQSN